MCVMSVVIFTHFVVQSCVFSSSGRDATPSRLARLHEHEYEDQSDNEQTSNGANTCNNHEVFWKVRIVQPVFEADSPRFEL